GWARACGVRVGRRGRRMSEKLVLWKWDAWRRADGWLVLIVPPIVAAGARLIEHGSSLWGAALAFAVPALLPGLSTALAARLSAGEWVTEDEHRRRTLEKLLDHGPARAIAWIGLGAFMWMAATFGAFVDLSNRPSLLLLLGISVFGALVVAV